MDLDAPQRVVDDAECSSHGCGWAGDCVEWRLEDGPEESWGNATCVCREGYTKNGPYGPEAQGETCYVSDSTARALWVFNFVFAVVLIALFMFFEFNMLSSLESSRRWARSTLMLTLRDFFILLMPLWLTVLGALHQNSLEKQGQYAYLGVDFKISFYVSNIFMFAFFTTLLGVRKTLSYHANGMRQATTRHNVDVELKTTMDFIGNKTLVLIVATWILFNGPLLSHAFETTSKTRSLVVITSWLIAMNIIVAIYHFTSSPIFIDYDRVIATLKRLENAGTLTNREILDMLELGRSKLLAAYRSVIYFCSVAFSLCFSMVLSSSLLRVQEYVVIGFCLPCLILSHAIVLLTRELFRYRKRKYETAMGPETHVSDQSIVTIANDWGNRLSMAPSSILVMD